MNDEREREQHVQSQSTSFLYLLCVQVFVHSMEGGGELVSLGSLNHTARKSPENHRSNADSIMMNT